jgi:hypothetical protein
MCRNLRLRNALCTENLKVDRFASRKSVLHLLEGFFVNLLHMNTKTYCIVKKTQSERNGTAPTGFDFGGFLYLQQYSTSLRIARI